MSSCSQMQCMNGGSCQQSGSIATCACPTGCAGSQCENSIHENSFFYIELLHSLLLLLRIFYMYKKR